MRLHVKTNAREVATHLRRTLRTTAQAARDPAAAFRISHMMRDSTRTHFDILKKGGTVAALGDPSVTWGGFRHPYTMKERILAGVMPVTPYLEVTGGLRASIAEAPDFRIRGRGDESRLAMRANTPRLARILTEHQKGQRITAIFPRLGKRKKMRLPRRLILFWTAAMRDAARREVGDLAKRAWAVGPKGIYP